jgi:hypothetical protein
MRDDSQSKQTRKTSLSTGAKEECDEVENKSAKNIIKHRSKEECDEVENKSAVTIGKHPQVSPPEQTRTGEFSHEA